MTLKARLLPFQKLATTVNRIAVTASHGDAQGVVTVVCRLTSPSAQRLSPGMSGYARIRRGYSAIGAILLETSPGVASYRGLVVGGLSADFDRLDRESPTTRTMGRNASNGEPPRPGWSRSLMCAASTVVWSQVGSIATQR